MVLSFFPWNKFLMTILGIPIACLSFILYKLVFHRVSLLLLKTKAFRQIILAASPFQCIERIYKDSPEGDPESLIETIYNFCEEELQKWSFGYVETEPRKTEEIKNLTKYYPHKKILILGEHFGLNALEFASYCDGGVDIAVTGIDASTMVHGEWLLKWAQIEHSCTFLPGSLDDNMVYLTNNFSYFDIVYMATGSARDVFKKLLSNSLIPLAATLKDDKIIVSAERAFSAEEIKGIELNKVGLKLKKNAEARLKFNEFDKDGDGYLDNAELLLFANWIWDGYYDSAPQYKDLQKIKRNILRKVRSNRYQQVSWDEFCKFYEEIAEQIGKVQESKQSLKLTKTVFKETCTPEASAQVPQMGPLPYRNADAGYKL